MTSLHSSPAPPLPEAGAPTTGPLRGWALANLVAQSAIIVTGGLVRLTGSGLGCPVWPQCVPGSYTPVETQAQGWHPYVEFGNRLLTFVLTAVAVGLFVMAWQRREHLGRGRLVLAAVAPAGVVFQALLGGVTVLTNLSPVTVAAHFLVSAGLVVAATWLWCDLGPARPGPRSALPPEVHWLAAGVVAAGLVVVVLGTVVTGSGPHSGDADQPARFGFDPALVSWLHADAVWLFCALVVGMLVAVRLAGADRPVHSWTRHVLAVTLLQGVVGYVQYFTGLPVWVVALHLVGAVLVVIGTTGLAHAVHASGVRVRAGDAPA